MIMLAVDRKEITLCFLFCFLHSSTVGNSEHRISVAPSGGDFAKQHHHNQNFHSYTQIDPGMYCYHSELLYWDLALVKLGQCFMTVGQVRKATPTYLC